MAIGGAEEMEWVRTPSDEFLSDIIHFRDSLSLLLDAAFWITEIAGSATAFLPVKMGNSSGTQNVLDVVGTGNGIVLIAFLIGQANSITTDVS